MKKKVKWYEATIIFEGKPGEREPSAKLEDGREFPMGWNMGQSIPVGTKGKAAYLVAGNQGLWQFKLGV